MPPARGKPVHNHPNRLRFDGILTTVDQVSDAPPSGARGHRVILTRGAALAALPSLIGMAVDYRPSWDGHDSRRKCGIVTYADVLVDELHIRGYIFAKDFPDVAEVALTRDDLGMSWELDKAHIEDMRAENWVIGRATFTGAAILRKDEAAYRTTSFRVGKDTDTDVWTPETVSLFAAITPPRR